jgi:hypothetical protein
MIIELDEVDNDIFIKHLYEFNKNVSSISDKLVMDCLILNLEFKEHDIIFKVTRIETIKMEGLHEDHYGKSSGKIGDVIHISINSFGDKYKTIFRAAIREIKINKLVNDNR